MRLRQTSVRIQLLATLGDVTMTAATLATDALYRPRDRRSGRELMEVPTLKPEYRVPGNLETWFRSFLNQRAKPVTPTKKPHQARRTVGS
jgi:hypothetical protein